MQNNETILGGVDAESAAVLIDRREAIKKGGKTGISTALALGSIPIALAALSREVYGQSTPATVQATIDFALKLEIFENEFYKAVLGTSTSAAQNAAFAPVRALVPASALPAFQKIQQHEAAHVAFLRANGAMNTTLTADSFDFTGNRGVGGPGPFARATSELDFLLAVTQAAEDTGVRAYKGGAGALMSNSVILEAALRIHSVEARHAAKIRRIRRGRPNASTVLRYSGTVSGADAAAAGVGNISNPPAAVVAAFNLIYANEGTTMQGTVDVSTSTGLPSSVNTATAASEAFDEALTGAQVATIVQPFFIPNF